MARKTKPAATALIEGDEDFAPDDELKELLEKGPQSPAPPPALEAGPEAKAEAPAPPKQPRIAHVPGVWRFTLRGVWVNREVTLVGVEPDTEEAARKALHEALEKSIQRIERTR